MLAVLRPENWEWPVFLHVGGAFALVGGTVAVAVLGVASARHEGTSALVLRRLALRTTLIVVLPAFVLMRAAAEWALSRENDPEGQWVDIGFIVGDIGALVVIALAVLGWLALRRVPRLGGIAGGLAVLYAAALILALWAMTTKPL